MKTWDDYKQYVKEVNPEDGQVLDELESISAIISAMIDQRNALGISQRELASMCGMPQSSVARIENFKTIPHLDTLLKIMNPLGLTLTVQTKCPQ